MPAAFSHWLLGKRIINDNEFIEQFPNLCEDAFLWGCQGPDILFYHHLLPWQKKDSLKKYGGILHECAPTPIFNSLGKICRYFADADHSNLIYSYALGFCCHYCYDRKLHPLVYYNTALLEKTDERGSNYKYHADIEANMDILLLRHETGKLTSEISIRECLPLCSNLDRAIAKLYALLLSDLFKFRPSAASVNKLADDFRFNIGLLDDTYAVKKPLVGAAEKILPNLSQGSFSGLIHAMSEDNSFDYANILKSTWFNPDDRRKTSNANLYEITNEAEMDTRRLMKLLDAAAKGNADTDFTGFTQGLNFEGRQTEDLDTITL